MSNSSEIDVTNSLFTENYMPRPRVDKILDKVTLCKLVYVIAGAGYGKTRAVHNYLDNQENIVVRWLQLTENDNTGTRYWENLTHDISFDNPDLAARLRELGFPDTVPRFKQFGEIIKEHEHRSNKTYLVLDDFHLIQSKQALTFAERCAHLQIPGACVIILTRKEPDINTVSLFSKGLAGKITEDELRFTKNEIAEFMQRCSIPFSPKDLPLFVDATKGWALAIKLLSMVLKRTPGNLDHAFETMKQNVYKLLETEAFTDFPENVQKSLIQLSLVSDLPLMPLSETSGGALFEEHIPQLASFVWYDSFIGDYRIHPLYMEFLQSKHDLLSPAEKQETYKWAAEWCSDNGFFMNAMDYYGKSFQYDKMLSILLSYPFKLPYDACEFFLSILEKVDPNDEEKSDRSILVLKNTFFPLLLMGMDRYEDARTLSLEIIRRWENSKKPIAKYLLYTAYSNLTYIDTFTCTVTHKYDFPQYLKKAVERYKGPTTTPMTVKGPFAVVDIRSYACLVGEGAQLHEFDTFLEKARETAEYVAQTYHLMYYGYDDLVACELAFFRNQLESARNHAHNTILKARDKKQYSIEALAQYYMLRMAAYEGDYPLLRGVLKQMQARLDNTDFWNRQQLYDLSVGSFYCAIGQPEIVPAWIAMDEKEAAADVGLSSWELIVNVRYHFAQKKFKRALAILCNSYPRAAHERFYFSELILTLLLATARLRTGDAEGALIDLKKAYDMSFEGEFEMPFVELGRGFHALSIAALKSKACDIPEKWLTTVDRKASAFVKKMTIISNSFIAEQNIDDSIRLSDRERKVLNDLYHGLSREEIAVTQYLSINTVKKILQSIYIKLGANNNVDAIRIAIENKLVE